MAPPWPISPWVEAYHHRIGFGLQVFPIDTAIDPARHLLAASQWAEELGFDAFFVGDHPAWALEGRLHLAAIAVTYSTGWLILAKNANQVQAKLQHYFPEGLEKRYSGPWASFVFVGTPQDAVSYYQALADAGIQYFVVETLDAADEETIRLLAEQVVPEIKSRQ